MTREEMLLDYFAAYRLWCEWMRQNEKREAAEK